MTTSITRAGLLVLGLVLGAVGAAKLADLGVENAVQASLWLAAGVVLHDGVLVPLTIGLGWVASRAGLPMRPVVASTILLGPVTLLAIPVLGRFGAKADNPTLLDRDYLLGWFAMVGVVVLLVVIGHCGQRLRPKQRMRSE